MNLKAVAILISTQCFQRSEFVLRAQGFPVNFPCCRHLHRHLGKLWVFPTAFPTRHAASLTGAVRISPRSRSLFVPRGSSSPAQAAGSPSQESGPHRCPPPLTWVDFPGKPCPRPHMALPVRALPRPRQVALDRQHHLLHLSFGSGERFSASLPHGSPASQVWPKGSVRREGGGGICVSW